MLPLHAAIEEMNEAAVRNLLGDGEDINTPDPSLGGCRPLQLAVDIECELACRLLDEGELDARPVATLSRLLLGAGANPDLPDDSGASARSVAREREHVAALRLFDEYA